MKGVAFYNFIMERPTYLNCFNSIGLLETRRKGCDSIGTIGQFVALLSKIRRRTQNIALVMKSWFPLQSLFKVNFFRIGIPSTHHQ